MAAARQAICQLGVKRRHWLARLAFLSGARWGAGRLAKQIDALLDLEDNGHIDRDDLIDIIDKVLDYVRKQHPKTDDTATSPS